jgi:hypothetical protein
VATKQAIFFLWRPLLPDPNDDMVVEVAIAASCEAIVTHNIRDFATASGLGVRIMTPGEFLMLLFAEQEGISINQLINSAVAEKLAALMTQEYLAQRASRGNRKRFDAVLAKVPAAPPMEGDELPAGYRRRRSRKAG